MPTPLEIINSPRRGAPVTVYNGAPAMPRRQAAPTRRTGARRPSGPMPRGRVDWDAVEAEVFSTKGAQERFQQRMQEQMEAEQPPPEEPGGFWGSDFGKGLGFVINNPVTRAVTTPLNYMQTLGRGAVLGIEELAERGKDLPTWAKVIPGLSLGTTALTTAANLVDTDRTEADKRSNWNKVFAPNTTYGFGELIAPPGEDATGWEQWRNRGIGLAGDIAFDPLTYVGGGATRAVQGATRAQGVAEGLARAERALAAAQDAGKARNITRAEEALEHARAAVTAMETNPLAHEPITHQIPMPRTRQERVNLMGELSESPAGREFLMNNPAQARRAGMRGFQTITPEMKQLLGISEPGLRIRGMGVKIPGTGPIAEGLNRAGGAARAGMARIPSRSPMNPMNLRVPRGLEGPSGVLTRGRSGDLMLAASTVAGRNSQRIGLGAQLARGGHTLFGALRDLKKQYSNDDIRRLVTEAETTGVANEINEIPKRILETYQRVTGRVIDQQYLRDPNTYYPHMLSDRWRRTLRRLAKGDDEAAKDFLKFTDTEADELLEQGTFYLDNTMDGSGFLEKARKIGTRNGEPQTINFGGVDVTFTADDVGHLNEQLHKAFPDFKGDFYETDPAKVFEAYNTSLARQAARDFAERRYLEVGNPLVGQMTGDLEATRQALNTALAGQDAAPLLSTAQGRYDPTQPLPQIPERPLVPGSAEDRARRAAVEAANARVAGATTPQEAVAEFENLNALPAPTERIGGVAPEDYFVTTAGTEATAARNAAVTRSKTYARAAAAELNASETKVRSSLDTIRERLVTPLRTSVEETGAEIKKVNTRIKRWREAITEFGPMTADNVDDLTLLTTKVEEQILNAETKLRRTAATWKGRATRAQRKSEAELRASLRQLKEVRDRAHEAARQAPQRMMQEYHDRINTLMQPVREAQEALLRAELAVPVPSSQAGYERARATIEAARAEVEGQVGQRPVEDLLAEYNKVLEDMRTGAVQMARTGARVTPELQELQEQYRNILQTLNELLSRPRRKGQLSKANQKLLDEALAERNRLSLALGQGVPSGQSPYDMAQLQMASLESEIARYGERTLEQQMDDVAIESAVDAYGGAAPEPQRLVFERPENVDPNYDIMGDARYAVSNVLGDMVRRGDEGLTEAFVRARGLVDSLSDGNWQKFLGQIWNRLPRDAVEELEAAGWRSIGPDPSDIGAKQRQLANLRGRFEPGGSFYDEQEARRLLVEMDAYEREVGRATGDQRRALQKAEEMMRMRQEAIIWGNRSKTMRLYGEEQGFGQGEVRIPEPIKSPPQREAFMTEERIMEAEGPGRLRPVPQPRTEQEALQSLHEGARYGTPLTRGLRETAEAKDIEADIAQATLPARISASKEEIATKIAAQADQELGPLAERVKTYTTLNNDLTDKTNLVRKRDEARALRDRLNDVRPKTTRDLGRTVNEIESVARANPLLDNESLAATESLLQTHRTELQRIGEGRIRVSDLDRIAKDAADNKLGPVMVATLNNNWKALRAGPLREGSTFMDTQLAKAHMNLWELNRQPKLLSRVINAYTNLFKTYATFSPGFFIRNTIGGIFMNTADGVRLTAQLEGAKMFQQWMKSGDEWLVEQPKRVQDAFAATFASGAGGRVQDTGVAARTGSSIYNFLSANWGVMKAQRFGTRVEGAMRLGMALDSIDRGDDVARALQRISRVHFDYSQVSQLDETMKQIIPFWTFMSRNLPLQIQEMWTNPRVYAYYDHVVNNFQTEEDEFTPGYWTRQGAWATPISIGGMPVYAQPDLGFTRVQGDIKLMSDALGGQGAGGLFATANPALAAPLDFFNRRDSFYDRTFEPTDFKQLSGPIGTPISWLARPIGQTNEAGQVDENFINLLQSLIPTLNQAMRLAPEASGSERSADTWSRLARYFGAPTQLLTPAAQESEYWRQYREMRDEMERQQAMAAEAAS